MCHFLKREIKNKNNTEQIILKIWLKNVENCPESFVMLDVSNIFGWAILESDNYT